MIGNFPEVLNINEFLSNSTSSSVTSGQYSLFIDSRWYANKLIGVEVSTLGGWEVSL